MISNDPHLEALCTENDVDIVMSSSTFQTLIDMHGPVYHEAWELPITVRRYGDKLTVLVDKPLIKPRYTMREKNQMFFKHAFTSQCLPRAKSVTPLKYAMS